MDKTIRVGTIPISTITVGTRFRKDYGTALDWQDFKDDIDRKGLINAITVHQENEDLFTLLAGGRRLAACAELGHTEIGATIYTGEIDESDLRIIELTENIKRKDLTVEEEVNAKRNLIKLLKEKYGEKTSTLPDAPGISVRDVAKMLGESQTNLQRDVELANIMDMKPELKKVSNKAEALRSVQRYKRQFVDYQAVQKFDEETKNDSEETVQARVARWFKLGDFFKEIKKVADGVVDLVELDPPQGINLMEKKKSKDTIATPLEAYNEIPQDEYPVWIRKVLKECYRILKPDSWLVFWFGVEPWFEFIYHEATGNGFPTIRKTLGDKEFFKLFGRGAGFTGRRLCGEWTKLSGQTQQPSKYLANASEWFFYFAKGNPNLHKQGCTNLFHFSTVTPNKKIHPTERPVELMQEVLDVFCWPGALVAVPFAGSGNTLRAAANSKMLAFGYDLSEEYRNAHIRKCYEAVPPNYKSF